jgi:uncharacterized tellurite resistance protein B-like protein
MLKTIKNYFDKHLSSQPGEDLDHQLKLATAALLVEMMQQDEQEHISEKQAIRVALQSKFALSESETEDLYQLARQEVAAATDYFQFTNLIARNFSQQQKIKVIEFLWTIAYADNSLDAYEEHMVRRIADLIYVSHKDFMQTKHKVQQKLARAQ